MVQSIETAPEIFERLAGLGYWGCAVETELPNRDFDSLASTARVHGIQVVRKSVVETYSREDGLRRLRRKGLGELVSLLPRSREAMLLAARDERVATVVLDGKTAELDRHIIQVLRNPLEFGLRELATSVRDGSLEPILRAMRVISKKSLPMVFSSHASAAAGLRSARQLAYTLQAFGLEQSHSLDAVSEVPAGLVERVAVRFEREDSSA